jgi:hypothetical protein
MAICSQRFRNYKSNENLKKPFIILYSNNKRLKMFKNSLNYYQFPEHYQPVYKKQEQVGGGVAGDIAKGVAKEVAGPVVTDTLGDISNEVGSNINAVSEIMDGNVSQKNIDQIVSSVIDIFKFGKALAEPPRFQGEKHGVLRLSDGSYKKAAFMGPSTNVVERLRLGGDFARPLTEVDKISFRHDLDYYAVKEPGDIRAADERMLKSVAKSKAEGSDHPFNLTQAQLIAFKTKLEDMGVSPERFTSYGGIENLPQSDQNNQIQALGELVQQGYGTKFDDIDIEKFKNKQYPKPADRLYNKLVKKNKKKKKQKIPKRVQKKILSDMNIQDQFEDQEIPDNIRIALSSF